MSIQKRLISTATAILMIISCIAAMTLFAPAASAATTVKSQQSEIAKLENEIAELQKQYDSVNSEYNNAIKGAIRIDGMRISDKPLAVAVTNGKLSTKYWTGYYISNYKSLSKDYMESNYPHLSMSGGGYVKIKSYNSKRIGTLLGEVICHDVEAIDTYAYNKQMTSIKDQISAKKESLSKLKKRLSVDQGAKVRIDTETGTCVMTGNTLSLKYSFVDKNSKSVSVSNKDVTWSSSNTEVASINSSGILTAKKAGTVKITCKSALNGTSSKIKIKVVGPAKSLKMSERSLTMHTEDTYALSVQMSPKSSMDDIYWISSDISVAKVSTEGVVTAVAPGSASIFAYTHNKVVSLACKITVEGEYEEFAADTLESAIYQVKNSGLLAGNQKYYFSAVYLSKTVDDVRIMVTAYYPLSEYIDAIYADSSVNRNDLNRYIFYVSDDTVSTDADEGEQN